MCNTLYSKFYKISLLILMMFPLFSEGNLIEVIYPRERQKVYAGKKTFILGNVPPEAALVINGEKIKVYRTGGFLAYLPVKSGDFKFVIEAAMPDGTIHNKVLPVRIPVTKPLQVTKEEKIEKSQYLPKVDRGVILGDEVTFQCKTIPGQNVKVSIQDDVYTLKEQKQESVAGIYRKTEHLRKPMKEARFSFSVEGRENIKPFSPPVKITVLPPEAYPVLEIVKDKTKARFYPGGGYDTFLRKGTKLKSQGFTGKWQKLKLSENRSVYVQNKQTSIADEVEINKEAIVGNIRSFETERELVIEIPRLKKVNGTWLECSDENKLSLKLYNTQLNVDRISYPPTGILKNILWEQVEQDVVRLDFYTDFPPLYGYWLEFKGNRARIYIRKPVKGRKNENIKICLDAGHGGNDSGTVGPTGLTEKEANLSQVKLIAEKLKEKGFDVILTRIDDKGPGLYERAPMAFKEKADFFISIHHNAVADGVNPYKARSSETYFYNQAGKALGMSLHPKVVEVTRIPDAGLKYGNLAVCRNNAVPSVLIEIDYLLLPEAEERVMMKTFQQEIAESICKGVEDYIS